MSGKQAKKARRQTAAEAPAHEIDAAKVPTRKYLTKAQIAAQRKRERAIYNLNQRVILAASRIPKGA